MSRYRFRIQQGIGRLLTWQLMLTTMQRRQLLNLILLWESVKLPTKSKKLLFSSCHWGAMATKRRSLDRFYVLTIVATIKRRNTAFCACKMWVLWTHFMIQVRSPHLRASKIWVRLTQKTAYRQMGPTDVDLACAQSGSAGLQYNAPRPNDTYLLIRIGCCDPTVNILIHLLPNMS